MFLGRLTVLDALIVFETTAEDCPCLNLFPLQTLYWPFGDTLARIQSPVGLLATFRRVRDAIDRIPSWLSSEA
jgi:hypothetical protein